MASSEVGTPKLLSQIQALSRVNKRKGELADSKDFDLALDTRARAGEEIDLHEASCCAPLSMKPSLPRIGAVVSGRHGAAIAALPRDAEVHEIAGSGKPQLAHW